MAPKEASIKYVHTEGSGRGVQKLANLADKQ